MMLRLSTWLWLGLVAIVGCATYQIKFQVTQLEDELVHVNHAIDADRDQLRVLNTEWSYLNQPGRLDQLRKRYLTLDTVKRDKIGTIDAIPFRAGGEGDAPLAGPAPQPSPAGPKPAPIALPGGAALASAKGQAPK